MTKFIKKEWKALAIGGTLSLLFLLMPFITFKLSKLYVFSEYLHLDAPRLTAEIRRGMSFPLNYFIPYRYLSLAAIPLFFLLAFCFAWIFRKTRNYHFRVVGIFMTIFLGLYIFPDSLVYLEGKTMSSNKGHVANGSMSNGKRVNFRGENYSTYSFPLYLLGRTFAHEKVRKTILDAYEICEKSAPETKFILGEIGWKSGGRFLPHRTHQKGTSVDFMTPYLKYEKSYSTNHLFNLWGYQLEFNEKGETDKYQIDFEATAQHIYALKKAASQNGLVIQKIIFDPVLRRQLSKTSVWPKIKNLPFTRNRVAWRHDDHYHVDFSKRKISAQ